MLRGALAVGRAPRFALLKTLWQPASPASSADAARSMWLLPPLPARSTSPLPEPPKAAGTCSLVRAEEMMRDRVPEPCSPPRARPCRAAACDCIAFLRKASAFFAASFGRWGTLQAGRQYKGKQTEGRQALGLNQGGRMAGRTGRDGRRSRG